LCVKKTHSGMLVGWYQKRGLEGRGFQPKTEDRGGVGGKPHPPEDGTPPPTKTWESTNKGVNEKLLISSTHKLRFHEGGTRGGGNW